VLYCPGRQQLNAALDPMQSALLLACVVAVAPGFAHSSEQRITPSQLQARIDAEGERQVLRALWEREVDFEALLAGIESGNSGWLKIAVALRPFSDAAVSESIDGAVARALPEAPAAVLALVGHGFEIEYVCTSPFIEPDPGVAEEYEQRALAALASVQTPSLKALATECAKRVRLAPREKLHGV